MRKICKLIFSYILLTLILTMLVLPTDRVEAKTDNYYISQDNIIDSGKPDQYSKCNTYGDIGSWDAYGGHSFRYLAKIDLKELTKFSLISKAVFKIDRVSTSWDDDDNYVLYKITSNWNVNSVTWNSQPTIAQIGVNAKKLDNRFYEFDVTDILKGWLNDPSSNFGIIIKKEVENTALKNHKGSFACSSYPVGGAESVPVLEVTTGNTISIQDAPDAGSNPVESQNIIIESDTFQNSYKAIVKIKTYNLDEYYGLNNDSYGSGVLISNSGLILTNNHVVESKDSFDNSDKDSGYIVCLPKNTTEEPDCSFVAKLISKNKDLDIALLQIQNIPGMSDLASYPYLQLSPSDTANPNDEVMAIGYPDIGDSSVTITKGIVSGKMEKYGKKWIKTDAVISFGSSGGAALNKNNEVIGITSAGHSDLLGSLGYIINISSVSQWIKDNKAKQPKTSSLISRVYSFAQKEKAIANSDLFENSLQTYSITKPQEWSFEYLGENKLYIDKPSDEEGGMIMVQTDSFPYKVDINNIVPSLKMNSLINGNLSFFSMREDKNVKVSGLPAKKLLISGSTSQTNLYAIPLNDRIIYLIYNYGVNDKDKGEVDKIISSFKIKNKKTSLIETRKYSNSNPKFSIATENDWVIEKDNSKDTPLVIFNKKYKDIYVRVSITKTSDNNKKLNNDGWLKLYKEQMDKVNKMAGIIDTKFVLSDTSAHYKLNKNLKDVIKVITTIKTPSNGKSIAYKINYTQKISDKYLLDVLMLTTNPDKKIFANYQKEFNKMLQTLSLPGDDFSKIDSDHDGLTDSQENIFGTNPNNPDTDGDGHGDGTEVKNGYNALGAGKMQK